MTEAKDRNTLLAEIARLLEDIDDASLNYAHAAARALADDGGHNTPECEFVRNVLGTYEHAGAKMTPKHAERDLDTFRENYENVQSVLKRYTVAA